MNIQSSFTVYTAALHALILNPLLLAYFWLGLSWIDSIDSISANKRFSSSKTSSRKPYSNSKQQEKQKHSAENTINFSSMNHYYVSDLPQDFCGVIVEGDRRIVQSDLSGLHFHWTLFFVAYYLQEVAFWDTKCDKNMYRWMRQRGAGGCCRGSPRVQHLEKEATRRE